MLLRYIRQEGVGKIHDEFSLSYLRDRPWKYPGTMDVAFGAQESQSWG